MLSWDSQFVRAPGVGGRLAWRDGPDGFELAFWRDFERGKRGRSVLLELLHVLLSP